MGGRESRVRVGRKSKGEGKRWNVRVRGRGEKKEGKKGKEKKE
jgi:hypothetical protein